MQIVDPDARHDLLQIVSDYTSRREAFTDVQVACDLRKRKSPAGVLPLRSVLAPALRRAFEDGRMVGYERRAVNGNLSAYLPVGASVPDHVTLLDQDWIAPVHPSEVVSGSLPIVPEPSLDQHRKYLRFVGDGVAVHRAWREGRFVEVPREMLREGGFESGTEVELVLDTPGRLFLREAIGQGHAAVQTRRHCLRLRRTLLADHGIHGDDGVIFHFHDGKIWVTAA